MNQTIECGKIINTHGIAGEVKIDSYCDEGFFRRISRISTGSETFEVLSSRSHKGFVLARLQGINTVEDLVNKSESEMMKVRNLGRKSLEEVIGKLAALGFTFAKDYDE